MTDSCRSSLRSLCLVLLALAASPAPALAAPAWLSPATVSGGTSDGLGSVAVGRNGEVIAVWVDRDAQQVMAAVRPPGGPFGAAMPVSAAGGAASFESPQIAVDGAGNAVVAWITPSEQVGVAIRAPGGRFRDLGPIDSPEPAGSLSLAINRDGVTALAWTTFDPGPGEWRLRSAVRPAGGGGFGSSTVLEGPTPGSIGGPDAAVAPDGTVLVAWSFFDFPSSRASYSIRPPGGPFGARQDADADTMNQRRYLTASVGIAADGEALAVYSREVGGGALQFLTARRAPGAASFTLDPVPFGSAPDAVDSLSFAMGADGTAVFGYRDFPNVYGAIRAPGAGFGAPALLPPADNAGPGTATAVGDDGTAMLAWARDGEIRAAVRRPGGALGASEQVAALGGGLFLAPAVAVDPAGNGVLAWTDVPADRTQEVIRAAGYDAAPPVLRALRFPAPGAAGTALAFSAAPFDVWSPVTTTWSFGDGASAAGQAVRHAFAAPGRFTARITATDAAGNAASATRRVDVTAPVVTRPVPPAADVAAPAVGGFRSSNAVFAVGRRATPVSAAARRVPRGTTFRYTLSEPARVTIAIRRAVRGLRSRGRCRPATRARARAILRRAGRGGLRRARCTRHISAGRALTRDGTTGANAVAFSGRIGRRALRPGRHRALLTATDAAGNRSPASRAAFNVVKPPKRA